MKGSPLTHEIKYFVSQRLGRDWRSIGRRLFWKNGNFLETETIIENIDHSYRFIQEKVYQLLILWQEQNSNAATAEALVQTLRSEKLNLLASQIEKLIPSHNSCNTCGAAVAVDNCFRCPQKVK